MRLILTDESGYKLWNTYESGCDLRSTDESGYNLQMDNASLYHHTTCIYMYVLKLDNVNKLCILSQNDFINKKNCKNFTS